MQATCIQTAAEACAKHAATQSGIYREGTKLLLMTMLLSLYNQRGCPAHTHKLPMRLETAVALQGAEARGQAMTMRHHMTAWSALPKPLLLNPEPQTLNPVSRCGAHR